jgi:release factor glutamine methyltransferase
MSPVYPPSEDSELLLEVALQELKKDDDVLEVGVGSGFVSSKLVGKCRLVIGTDISPHAVQKAKKSGVEVIRTNLVKGICKKFTLVLFNPPYLELEDFEKNGDWLEKAIDGGEKGVEIISEFLDEIIDLVGEEGRIILILSSNNLPHILEKIEKNFYSKVIKHKKLFFEELLALRLMKKA